MPILISKVFEIAVHLSHPVRMQCNRCGSRFVALGLREFTHRVSDTNLALLRSSHDERVARLESGTSWRIADPSATIKVNRHCPECRYPVQLTGSQAQKPTAANGWGNRSFGPIPAEAAIFFGVAIVGLAVVFAFPNTGALGWFIFGYGVIGVVGGLVGERPLAPGRPLLGSLRDDVFDRRVGDNPDAVAQWATGSGVPSGHGHLIVAGPILDWTQTSPATDPEMPSPPTGKTQA